MKQEQDELPEFEEDYSENTENYNEEELEAVYQNQKKVYFLKTDGTWYSNTFVDETTAKIVLDAYNA